MPHHRTRTRASRWIATVLFGAILVACSDKAPPVEPTPTPPPLPPVVTGVLVGPPASATIGPSGGALALADGSASVTVPAGALPRATELTIQSITNIAPNGIGNGVRIGPENVTFAVPVTVTITYDPSATDSSSAEGFGIARQDSTGAWQAFLESTVTPSARIANASSVSLRLSSAARAGGAVAAQTRRTGHYVPGRLWIFRPESETVTTNGTVPLVVLACHDETQALPLPNVTVASLISVCAPSIRTPTWSVNGIVRGNATVGEVAPGAPTTATYRAPATVPSPSTVSVSVGLFWAARGVTKTFTSRITVVDPEIRLRLVATYFEKDAVLTAAPASIPASTEDRFTLDVTLSPDAAKLKEFKLLENQITAITSGGGFRNDDPNFCRPPEAVGVYDSFFADTTRAPFLKGNSEFGPGQFLHVYHVTRIPGALYFIKDPDAPGMCRTFTFYGEPVEARGIGVFRLPTLAQMPAPGLSFNIDERVRGWGWFLIWTRLTTP